MTDTIEVPRELLERWADKLESCDSAGFGWEDLLADEIRAILAQPAEADGVEVVAFIQTGNGMKPAARIGKPADLYFPGGDASGYTFEPLMTVARHQRILSAVTAERDARDWEMKAQGIESVLHYVVSKHDQDVLRMHAAEKRTEGKRVAAMAAKEGNRD